MKALKKIEEKAGVCIYNLGTGNGYSVLDMVKAFSKACGKEIKYEIKPRRAGDIATCYADPAKAKEELGWEAERGLDEMCEDSWRWQSNNQTDMKHKIYENLIERREKTSSGYRGIGFSLFFGSSILGSRLSVQGLVLPYRGEKWYNLTVTLVLLRVKI